MPVQADQYVKCAARAVFSRAPRRRAAPRRAARAAPLLTPRDTRRSLVRYRDYAGNAVSIGAEDFVVCRASDCLSMWEGDTLASALPAP